MDIFIVGLVLALVVLFLMYFLTDVNYFIRAIYIILAAKYTRSRLKFLKKSTIYGMVLPNDADLWITHCNNARVFREFDFARFDYLERTGLLKILIRENGGGVVGAQNCRYRRPLHMFMTYKVETAIVYYDSKTMYFEHKVITLKDNIVRCVAYVNLAVSTDFEKLVKKYYPKTVKPEMPKDLELWLEYNKLSSERLRALKKSSISVGENVRNEVTSNPSPVEGDHLLNECLPNNSSI